MQGASSKEHWEEYVTKGFHCALSIIGWYKLKTIWVEKKAYTYSEKKSEYESHWYISLLWENLKGVEIYLMTFGWWLGHNFGIIIFE